MPASACQLDASVEERDELLHATDRPVARSQGVSQRCEADQRGVHDEAPGRPSPTAPR